MLLDPLAYLLLYEWHIQEEKMQGGNGEFRAPGIFGIFMVLPGFLSYSWNFIVLLGFSLHFCDKGMWTILAYD